MPKVITANRLDDGIVVYLAAGGAWTTRLATARLAETDADLARLEATAKDAVAARKVVSVYAMDVMIADGHPEPKSVREKIRAAHRTTFPAITEIARSARTTEAR